MHRWLRALADLHPRSIGRPGFRAQPKRDAQSPTPDSPPKATHVGPGGSPATSAEEAGLSERQAWILDFGWEIMKANTMPHIFLWLAEDGWQGGHEIRAEPYDGQVAVRIKPWETLILPPNTTTN